MNQSKGRKEVYFAEVYKNGRDKADGFTKALDWVKHGVFIR